jgi:hypothetical protein
MGIVLVLPNRVDTSPSSSYLTINISPRKRNTLGIIRITKPMVAALFRNVLYWLFALEVDEVFIDNNEDNLYIDLQLFVE